MLPVMAHSETLSRGPLLLIFGSAFLAAAANGISMVAFPWLVLQRTGNATDASVVAAAATLPLLFATLVAGTAVDFLGRRRVAILSDTCLLYTSPSPRDRTRSRMPSSA